MTIIRNFLIKEIPKNIEQYKIIQINEGYLSFNPEVRIINKKDRFYLFAKASANVEIFETQISSEAYNELSLLCKDRYRIPLYEQHTAIMDVCKKDDFSIVKVEFFNIEEANLFIIPDWFGEEIIKNSVLEIERKFLVKKVPGDLTKYKYTDIEQGYLNFNPEVRIRNKKGIFYFTVKGNGTISREEYEIQISSKLYNELILKVQGRILYKIRYNIPLDKEYTSELDIYKNFEGLKAMVEVEFPNIKEADEFIIPKWFGKEVTKDANFKNKNLAIIKNR